MKRTQHHHGVQEHSSLVTVIGIGKLLKATLLIGASIGIFELLDPNAQETVRRWIREIRVDPDNTYIHSFLERAFALTPAELKRLSLGSLLYGGLFVVEGVGLLLKKHWAEYLTIVSTAVFLPLEVYEIWQRVTFVRATVFAINVAVVVYLIARARRRRTRFAD